MEKFKGKYRIPSARWQNWDYRWAGAYFVTICTKNREHLFGEIVDKQMAYSHVGVIADILWCEIKNHTKNVELGEYVVMPNNVHGIFILNGDNVPDSVVGTLHATSLQPTEPQPEPPTKNQTMANISPKSGSVSTVIRSYKSAVTMHARRLGFQMEWQTRFHDHVIRNDAEYQRIAQYIINNPLNWPSDKFYGNI
jgi:REP element-mobilizing transposase RayT